MIRSRHDPGLNTDARRRWKECSPYPQGFRLALFEAANAVHTPTVVVERLMCDESMKIFTMA